MTTVTFGNILAHFEVFGGMPDQPGEPGVGEDVLEADPGAGGEAEAAAHQVLRLRGHAAHREGDAGLTNLYGCKFNSINVQNFRLKWFEKRS